MMRCYVATLAILLLAGSAVTAGATSAQENYTKHCLKCHGISGRGDGPAADVLDTPAGDFTDCEHMNAVSDGYLLAIIRGGGEAVGRSTLMPSALQIDNDEHPALVDYIRSFCNKE